MVFGRSRSSQRMRCVPEGHIRGSGVSRHVRQIRLETGVIIARDNTHDDHKCTKTRSSCSLKPTNNRNSTPSWEYGTAVSPVLQETNSYSAAKGTSDFHVCHWGFVAGFVKVPSLMHGRSNTIQTDTEFAHYHELICK